jgi:hypothetical protein
MPLQIRPAVEADSERIGWIGRDAFRDSLSEAIFPPHLYHKSETGDIARDEAQWRAARNTARMREGKPTFVCVDVPGDSSGPGKIVACAQWALPAPPTIITSGEAGNAQDKYPIQEPLPPSLDEAALRELYKTVERETEKALGPDGYSKMWCKLPLG